MTRRCIDDTDRAIVRFVAEHQPTTVRLIAEAVGSAPSVIHGRVLWLGRWQLIEREPRIPRTIRLHPSVVVTDRGVYQLEKMP